MSTLLFNASKWIIWNNIIQNTTLTFVRGFKVDHYGTLGNGVRGRGGFPNTVIKKSKNFQN